MNVHAIIQARMGSTRLPGKVLMELSRKPILAWVIEGANQANVDKVIIATTNSSLDDQIAGFCQSNNVDFFRGSEDDVLDRHIAAAEKFASDIIVRITSDNPFGQSFVFDELISNHLDAKNDYTYSRGYPLGSACEVFTREALIIASKKSTEDYQSEHIGTYFIDNPAGFKIGCLEAPKEYYFPQIRLTVDTKDDFATAENIVKELGESKDLNKIIDLWKNDNSLFVNQGVVQFYPNEKIRRAYSAKISQSK